MQDPPVGAFDDSGRAAEPTLVGRLARWLSDHDPGGIDSTRALHLAISFILVICLGYATSRTFDLNLDVTFPMAGAMTALVLINFTPSASRRAEAISFGRLFALTIVLLIAVVIVAPGNAPANELGMKLMLVPLTCIALYLRRFGMEGQRMGIALIIIATVAAVLHPTRIQAAWLLLAAVQGGIVAFLVRFTLARPSALKVYSTCVIEAGETVGEYLRLLGASVRAGVRVPPPPADMLERIKIRVRAALVNAAAEDPQAREYIEAVRSLVYRLRVATQLLGDCIPDPQASDGAWRAPLAACADQLARHLERGLGQPFEQSERMRKAISRLREAAMEPDIAAQEQLALLRAVTAFDRLFLVVTDLSRLESVDTACWHVAPGSAAGLITPGPPPPGGPTAPAAPKGMPFYVKVAIQGLVATAITTTLDLVVGLDHAYWATMTVMFVLGNSLGETYVRVRYRTVGTLAGAIIGIALVVGLDRNIWLLAAACLIAQMIGLVTQRDRYDVASAATGLSVIVGLHLVTGLGADGMIARIYETAIGAIIALVVSFVVFPVYVADQIRNQVVGMVSQCRAAFANCWPRKGSVPGEIGNVTAALSADLRQLSERLPHIGAETSLGHRSAGDVVTLVSTLEILITYLALLEDVAHRLDTLSPPPETVTILEAARARTLAAFDQALGLATPAANPGAAPELDAAVSVALEMATNQGTRRLLPFVADYLSFSEAVLRPLADLSALLNPAAQAHAPKPAAHKELEAA
ncbi:FUSC family protein [Roseixanthobacter glucoisosaccharinicivorans]|uniref:FUSC family protein n=1 Tax=Roseixanthobacter glucoisosaccharinicivorans TaxID=3119923 RepID=UPI00372CB585